MLPRPTVETVDVLHLWRAPEVVHHEVEPDLLEGVLCHRVVVDVLLGAGLIHSHRHGVHGGLGATRARSHDQ